VAKAEDAWLEDVDGNRYLDFAGGIGCLNVGHRQQAVVDAVKDQLDRFLHTCVQVTPYESYVRLAERMNEVTPGKFAKKTDLCEQRRGGCRECGEDCAGLYQASRASSRLRTRSTGAR
jgi:4-aminobutyrate aminotransferase-like enzyme